MKPGERPPGGVKELILRLAGMTNRPTNEEIRREIERKFEVTISLRAIYRYCKDAGLRTNSRASAAGQKESGLDPREVRRELWRQSLLAHYEDIRRLGTEVSTCLPFWPLYTVDVRDLSGPSGEIPATFGGHSLRWSITPDHRCLRKLEDKFDPLIAHLVSPGQDDAIKTFGRWQELGSSCIKKLHALREEIIKEARKRTNLDMVASEPPQKGMLYDFWRSVYTWAVSTVDDEEYYTCHYTVASRTPDLCLLQMKGEANTGRVLSAKEDPRTLANLPPALTSNLAWVNDDELSAVTDAHKQMWTKYREFPLAAGIRRLAGQLEEVEDELAEAIKRFSKEELLTGKCSNPVCNPWITDSSS